ncbi:MAG: transcription termination/antitermination factor NusG [Pirellulales bacterium]|nr:transcription termination/antitermination factor NusG [Pirellulales bacterium]
MNEPNHPTDDPHADSLGAEPEVPVGGAGEAAPAEPVDEVGADATHGELQREEEEAVAAEVADEVASDVSEAEEPVAEEEEPVAEEEEEVGEGHPVELLSEERPDPSNKCWYILKVQSNREDSIRDALLRRVAIAGFEDYFDQIIIPTEMVTEFKNGKKRVVKKKLYPGYLMIHMSVNDDTWFLVRDTPGIGDFTGAGGKPIAMQEHEVNRLLAKQDEKTPDAPKLQISFKAGDRVKINEGTFENFEGDVDAIDEANGRVTVMINIFGRSTPVELEYWQIESV